MQIIGRITYRIKRLPLSFNKKISLNSYHDCFVSPAKQKPLKMLPEKFAAILFIHVVHKNN